MFRYIQELMMICKVQVAAITIFLLGVKQMLHIELGFWCGPFLNSIFTFSSLLNSSLPSPRRKNNAAKTVPENMRVAT